MGTFGNSWELAKLSFGILKKDTEILLLPLISGIFLIVIWVTMFASIFSIWFFAPSVWNSIWAQGVMFYILFVLLVFFLYVISFFIVIYFNAAVIACATIRLEGGEPTIRDGMKIASSHIGKIFMWALVSATIGLILQAISRRAGLAGKIASLIVGIAWSIATYFMIPIIIYENLGVWGSLKKSAKTFKNSFGETLVSNITLGLIILALGLVGLVPLGIGIWLFIKGGSLLIFIICLIIAFIYWIIIACIASAVEGILVAALYRFATTGKTHPDFMSIQNVVPHYTMAEPLIGKNNW